MSSSTMSSSESSSTMISSDEMSSSLSSKDVWDYEAPQFCDFAAMETFQPDPETDKFFLTDHESKENFIQLDLGSESDCFQTPTSDSAKQQHLDNSDCEFFSAKKSQFDSAILTTVNNNNNHEQPIYDLRNTPLRSLYSNGGTPLKETRKSQIFGRKSRKFLSNTIKKLNLNSDSLEKVDVSVDGAKTVTDNDNTIDLKSLNDALEEIDNSTKVVEVAEDQTTTSEETMMNVDPNETKDTEEINLISDEPTEEVDELTNLEDTLKFEDDIVNVKIALNVEEPTLPIVETFDAKIDDQTEEEEEKNESTVVNTTTANDNNNQSLNKSRRSSYLVVKSPVVPRSVRFSQAATIDDNDDDETTSEVVVDDNLVVTPDNKTVISKTKSANIKNRKGTPMFQPSTSKQSSLIKSTSSVTSNNGPLPSGRLARIKKYIKRFSKTPIKDNDDPLVVVPVQVAVTSNDVVAEGKHAEKLVPGSTEVKVVSEDTTKLNDPKLKPATIKVSKSKSLSFHPQPTTITRPPGKPNRLTVYSRKSRPLPTSAASRKSTASHLQQPTMSTSNLKRFVSAAEMSMNFWTSSRQYQPSVSMKLPPTKKSISSSTVVVDGGSKSKSKTTLTKPKSPKLLTQQRANHCIYHKPEPQDDVVNNSTRVVPSRKSTFKVTQNKENVTQNRIRMTISNNNRATTTTNIQVNKKLTKAKTPVFCTDQRRKQWSNKRNQQAKESKGPGPSTGGGFKARPVPDFKKIQLKNSNLMKLKRQQSQPKRNPTKINPFSFEQRELARKLAKKQPQPEPELKSLASDTKTY